MLLTRVKNAQTLLRLKPFPAVNSSCQRPLEPFMRHFQVYKVESYGGHMKGCSANVFGDITFFS